MSVISLQGGGSDEVRVTAGDELVLRLRAFDPTGISKIYVQCFQFSMASTNKLKLVFSELLIPLEESLRRT